MEGGTIAKFQIGKFGITPGVIDSLKLVFKTHHQVRISMLKSSGRDRQSIEKMADELALKLRLAISEFRFEYRIIGFTIVMNKFKAK